MNVIIGARGDAKKCNVPHRSQDKPNDDNAAGKFWCGVEPALSDRTHGASRMGAPPAKKLTDREEVCNARKRQRGHEVWPTSIAEVT
jgi:hypothetical protein